MFRYPRLELPRNSCAVRMGLCKKNLWSRVRVSGCISKIFTVEWKERTSSKCCAVQMYAVQPHIYYSIFTVYFILFYLYEFREEIQDDFILFRIEFRENFHVCGNFQVIFSILWQSVIDWPILFSFIGENGRSKKTRSLSFSFIHIDA